MANDDDIPEVLAAIRAGARAGERWELAARARSASNGLRSPMLAVRAEQHEAAGEEASAEAKAWLAKVQDR